FVSPVQCSLCLRCSVVCVSDRSFEDDADSADGNRAQAAFKVPKIPKKSAEFSAARRPNTTASKIGGASKDGTGGIDEEDFIKSFTDVPTVQIYSSRDLEDNLNKIREICSDDKHDWDQRAAAMKKIRSLDCCRGNGVRVFLPTPEAVGRSVQTSPVDSVGYKFDHAHTRSRLIPLITSNCTCKSVAVRSVSMMKSV
uniref:CLIP-associating protein 2-like n=1 Tax=Oncorhynchus gorbuscha TaxID=8017 RepID=UPI001EAF804E